MHESCRHQEADIRIPHNSNNHNDGVVLITLFPCSLCTTALYLYVPFCCVKGLTGDEYWKFAKCFNESRWKHLNRYLAIHVLLLMRKLEDKFVSCLCNWEGDYLRKGLRDKLIYVQADPKKLQACIFVRTVVVLFLRGVIFLIAVLILGYYSLNMHTEVF